MNDKRKRSPNYPFISMLEAEKYIRKLYDFIQTKAIPLPQALDFLDLTPTSSISSRIISAMMNYKIIEDQGVYLEKKIRITSLGEKIIQINRPIIVQIRFRREAVLNDEIMKDIFETFPKPANNETLIEYLQSNWGFTDSAIEQFISVVRENYSYAKLDYDSSIKSKLIQDPENHLVDNSEAFNKIKFPGKDNLFNLEELINENFIDYRIPIDAGRRFAYLIIPYDLSSTDVEYVQQHLEMILQQLLRNRR